MEFDFRQLDAASCYKLMVNLIVPRPIALVTTLGRNGVVNAAPFSVFNMIGEDPPLVMVSINKLKDGAFKDTARNIIDQQEFVVHIGDEACAAKLDATAAELPATESEIDHAGLTTTPSVLVAPPRIVEAPVAFECRLWETLESTSRFVFFGRILWLHVPDGLVDPANLRVDFSRFLPIGRFGAGQYVRTREQFSVIDGQCVAVAQGSGFHDIV